LATHQYDEFDRRVRKQVAEPIARRSGEMTLFIPPLLFIETEVSDTPGVY